MRTLFYASHKYLGLSPRSSWSGIIRLQCEGGINQLHYLESKTRDTQTAFDTSHTSTLGAHTKICLEIYGQRNRCMVNTALLCMDNLLFSHNSQAPRQASIQAIEYFGQLHLLQKFLLASVPVHFNTICGGTHHKQSEPPVYFPNQLNNKRKT